MSAATSTVEMAAPAPVVNAFDHLEWWVGNPRHTAQFWSTGFGFQVIAYAGPETGVRDRQSFVLRQGELTFVVTGPLDADSDIAHHVARHGDGVKDVALQVDDAAEAFDRLIARGAAAVHEPVRSTTATGHAVRAAIQTYGEVRHSLIERVGDVGPFLPGYEPLDLPIDAGAPVGLTRFDHVVANVRVGELDDTVEWYHRVFGFEPLQHFTEDAISTEYSALRSTVVWNHGRVVHPINEPAVGRRKSQIEEYLDYYGAPGVQHVAMRTDDILVTVAEMRRRGVRFLSVPEHYYDAAPDRLGEFAESLPWQQLAELGILVDRDRSGYLMQIFTETVASRPTAFMEVIQRVGAKGFGEGNFKALFQSIEAEQERRGNL
jgi:4-hydroxyphenylpyruvate dioxygenase